MLPPFLQLSSPVCLTLYVSLSIHLSTKQPITPTFLAACLHCARALSVKPEVNSEWDCIPKIAEKWHPERKHWRTGLASCPCCQRHSRLASRYQDKIIGIICRTEGDGEKGSTAAATPTPSPHPPPPQRQLYLLPSTKQTIIRFTSLHAVYV